MLVWTRHLWFEESSAFPSTNGQVKHVIKSKTVDVHIKPFLYLLPPGFGKWVSSISRASV